MAGLDTGPGRPTGSAPDAPGHETQQPPPEQPAAAPPPKPRLLSLPGQAWKLVAGGCAALALFATAITNWHTVKEALFPTEARSEAFIKGHVESDVSLPEYEAQAQLPGQGSLSATLLTPGGRSSYRLAAYVVPASTLTGAERAAASAPVTLAATEPTTSTQTTSTQTTSTQPTATTSPESQPKIKQESAQITEEAKHVEEAAAQEKPKAVEEQKSAEADERAEEKKVQEARKRAEQTSAQEAALAKAEEAKALRKVQQAKATVRAKKRNVARPPLERRVEAGKPALVEEVIHEAHVVSHCPPGCGLKPIIEKALQTTSNNTALAAEDARTVSRGPGVRVHYELTLKGLEHKVVELIYTLVQTNGLTPSELYTRPVKIRTVVPVHDPEVVHGKCWVPVPSGSRDYFLDLTVVDGTAELNSTETNHFF